MRCLLVTGLCFLDSEGPVRRGLGKTTRGLFRPETLFAVAPMLAIRICQAQSQELEILKAKMGTAPATRAD